MKNLLSDVRPILDFLCPIKNMAIFLVLVVLSCAAGAQKQSVPVASDYERPAQAAETPLPPALLQELTAIRDAAPEPRFRTSQALPWRREQV